MNPVAREPVISAGAITTLVEAGLLMAISLGILNITDDQMHQIMAFVIAVLGVVGPLWWARRATTALADPKDEDGVPLARADGGATRAQMRSMARQ